MIKTCKGCGLPKGKSYFYGSRTSRDGKTGKCKECIKKAVRDRYQETIVDRHLYERRRGPSRLKYLTKASRIHRSKYPDRYKARTAVSNALRDGRLTKGPCKRCGTTKRVQAHHRDYQKPLEVEWLCSQVQQEPDAGPPVPLPRPLPGRL